MTIYLDNSATTAIDRRVLEAMNEELQGGPANPSSIHFFGRDARNRLTRAQRSIAERLEVRPSELIFTSGGTEGANMVLRGLLGRGGEVVCSNVEHPCVASTLAALPCSVREVPPHEIVGAIGPRTKLVVMMGANNETGERYPIEDVALAAEGRGIPFFVDGVALLGKDRFTIPPGVSAMIFSGHKIHGPKGIGVAVVRHSLKLESQVTGGKQMYGRRGGTENLAGIIGMARAIELLDDADIDKMADLRDDLEYGLRTLLPTIDVNGSGPRVCGTTNLAFPGFEGDALLMNLDLAGIAVSHGSACSSGSLEPSLILQAMGYSRARAATSLRFSLSRFTTKEEIDRVISVMSGLLRF